MTNGLQSAVTVDEQLCPSMRGITAVSPTLTYARLHWQACPVQIQLHEQGQT